MPGRSATELVRRDRAAYEANYPDGPTPAELDWNELERKLAEEAERDLAELGHRPLRRSRPRWARRPTSRPSEQTGRTAQEGSTTR